MVTDNVGLNFSEPDSIICQNHVYDLSLLFLCEYGPPSSFQVHLIHVVLFLFEHILLLLQVFLFLYLYFDLSLWHGLRLFLFPLRNTPMNQMNLKGGRGPIFTQEQEREIINMVLANNAIRLREIPANIIGDHAIFNTVMSIRSLSQHWHTSYSFSRLITFKNWNLWHNDHNL